MKNSLLSIDEFISFKRKNKMKIEWKKEFKHKKDHRSAWKLPLKLTSCIFSLKQFLTCQADDECAPSC